MSKKKRDWSIYLEDIKTCIENILKYIEGMDFPAFKEDIRTRDAVIRNFEVMGKATKSIPKDIRNQFPQIDWKGMAKFRDVLIHQYFGINYKILWLSIEKLPVIREQVIAALEANPNKLF